MQTTTSHRRCLPHLQHLAGQKGERETGKTPPPQLQPPDPKDLKGRDQTRSYSSTYPWMNSSSMPSTTEAGRARAPPGLGCRLRATAPGIEEGKTAYRHSPLGITQLTLTLDLLRRRANLSLLCTEEPDCHLQLHSDRQCRRKRRGAAPGAHRGLSKG